MRCTNRLNPGNNRSMRNVPLPRKSTPSHRAGRSGPHLIHGSLGPQSPHPERHLGCFGHFAGLTIVTCRQTEHAPAAAISRTRLKKLKSSKSSISKRVQDTRRISSTDSYVVITPYFAYSTIAVTSVGLTFKTSLLFLDLYI